MTSQSETSGTAEFRIREGVKPYGGRKLVAARSYGPGVVIGRVPGATAERVYQLADLTVLNTEAVDVMEAANRERAYGARSEA